MDKSRSYRILRKRALKGLIADQWYRMEELEQKIKALDAEFSKSVMSHCEATIFLMGTAQVAGEKTFKASPVAYDHYVKMVHELGYTQMALVHKREALGRAQDRYNELVIELEDFVKRNRSPAHILVAEDSDCDDGECDELDAIDPPLPRAARRNRTKRSKKKSKDN